jgi:hypothetical protein
MITRKLDDINIRIIDKAFNVMHEPCCILNDINAAVVGVILFWDVQAAAVNIVLFIWINLLRGINERQGNPNRLIKATVLRFCVNLGEGI